MNRDLYAVETTGAAVESVDSEGCVTVRMEITPQHFNSGERVMGGAIYTIADFAFASTVRPDGTEVVALFNYEADETVRVSLDGREYEVEPFGVRFVETKKGNEK